MEGGVHVFKERMSGDGKGSGHSIRLTNMSRENIVHGAALDVVILSQHEDVLLSLNLGHVWFLFRR